MKMRVRRKVFWVAVFAAYLLIVQSLFAAFAIGAMAAPEKVDAFGNVICTSHGAQTKSEPSDPTKAASCCQWGCCSVLTAIALPRDVQGVVSVPAKVIIPTFTPYRSTARSGQEGSPGNPRAPPAFC